MRHVRLSGTASDAGIALRIGGWATIAIGILHFVGLLFPWRFFRWTTIEPKMRDLSQKHEALPYALTVLTGGAFVGAGLYALSATGAWRRLPFVGAVLPAVATGFLTRGLAGVPNGIADGRVRAARNRDVRELLFSAVATTIAATRGARGSIERPNRTQPRAASEEVRRPPQRSARRLIARSQPRRINALPGPATRQ